jgi:BTB/POZ domain
MSTAPTETPFDISPFDQPKHANVILLSSDNERFYVQKVLLILASEVFESMFTLPQGTQESEEHIPVVRMEEGKTTLHHLLLWCDPGCTPSWEMENIELVLSAAVKYDMRGIVARISQVLTSTGAFVTAEPFKLYVIGIRYDLKELARMAARKALSVKLEEFPDTPELEGISGVALQRLYRYKDQCRMAAEKVARESLGWVEDHKFVWALLAYPAGCNRCQFVCFADHRWASWWVDYMRLAGAELYKRPCGSTVEMGAAFGMEPVRRAFSCDVCRTRCYTELAIFSRLFAEEVERKIAEVSTARWTFYLEIAEENQISLVI